MLKVYHWDIKANSKYVFVDLGSSNFSLFANFEHVQYINLFL